MPYLQVIREMCWDGSPSPHLVFVSHAQSKLSAGVAQKMKIKDLKITVFLFLDVACSGSNSRMRLSLHGGAFYTMIFPCF